MRKTPRTIVNKTLLAISWLVWKIDKKHRKIININLDLAYGSLMDEEEKARIERKCYDNLAYLVADFIDNQHSTKDELLSKVTFTNAQVLDELNNKQIIFITAHYGNWELGSLANAAIIQNKIAIVGRPLDSTNMDNILRATRERFNVELINKKGAMKSLTRAIKEGKSIGIAADQNTADSEGVLVDFFGKQVRHTPAASILSRRFQIPIVPIFIQTTDQIKFNVIYCDAIMPISTDNPEQDIAQLTQAQALATENIIRNKPDEWFWFHKRWKNKYENAYK